MVVIEMFLSLLMLSLSALFLSASSPLPSVVILLFYTTVSCFSMGGVGGDRWFSYILFLVFVGGVLVLFIYTAALAPNSKYTFNLAGGFKVLTLTGGGLIGGCVAGGGWVNLSGGVGAEQLGATLSYLYGGVGVSGVCFMIIYLLLALVVVVKMVSGGGALRSMS